MTRGKTITLFLFLLLGSMAFGQESAKLCTCSAFLDNKVVEKDTANKHFYVMYDKIEKEFNEPCNDLKLLKDSAGYFYVEPFYMLKAYKGKQFRLKNNAQFLVNPLPDESGNFVLYANHDDKSNKVFQHTYSYEKNNINQVDTHLTVLTCFNEWLKISFTFNGKEYIGWTKRYCPLGCTTCN